MSVRSLISQFEDSPPVAAKSPQPKRSLGKRAIFNPRPAVGAAIARCDLRLLHQQYDAVGRMMRSTEELVSLQHEESQPSETETEMFQAPRTHETTPSTNSATNTPNAATIGAQNCHAKPVWEHKFPLDTQTINTARPTLNNPNENTSCESSEDNNLMRNEFMASAAKPLPRVPLEMVQIDSPIVYEPTTTPPIPLFPKLRRPVETAKPQNRKPEVPQKVKPADFAEAVSETDSSLVSTQSNVLEPETHANMVANKTTETPTEVTHTPTIAPSNANTSAASGTNTPVPEVSKEALSQFHLPEPPESLQPNVSEPPVVPLPSTESHISRSVSPRLVQVHSAKSQARDDAPPKQITPMSQNVPLTPVTLPLPPLPQHQPPPAVPLPPSPPPAFQPSPEKLPEPNVDVSDDITESSAPPFIPFIGHTSPPFTLPSGLSTPPLAHSSHSTPPLAPLDTAKGHHHLHHPSSHTRPSSSPNSVFTDYSTKENNTSMCDTPATPMRDIFTESPESPSKRVHRFSASGPVWFKMPDQPSNLSDAIVEEDSDTESTDYEMDEDIRKKWYNIFNTKVKRAPPPPPDQDPVRKGSIVPGLFKRTLSTSSPKKTSFPSPAKVSTNMLRYPHLEMNRAPATSNSVFLPSTTSTGTQSSHVHPHLYRAHLRSPATPTRHKFDAIPQMAAKKCSIGIQTDEPKHLTPEENHLLNNFSELRGSIQSALSSETRGLGDSNLTEDYIDFSQYLDKKFQLV